MKSIPGRIMWRGDGLAGAAQDPAAFARRLTGCWSNIFVDGVDMPVLSGVERRLVDSR